MQVRAMCGFCGRDIADDAGHLLVLKQIMCSDCERKLVGTAVDDDDYKIFMEKIKKLWFA
ncbi:MAG: hypothetical protein CVU89_09535 [Firmicutes bacterium HGW-Firmicutes-14]|jgi:ribosomal protein L24E|nr:MAG: hypothetical protein CVU89_09535 [Firmicutes bacterium HGW-Firmicutes-14]